MNFSYKNAEGCLVSAVAINDAIRIECDMCGGTLRGNKVKALRKRFKEIDDLEWTAQYSEAERNLLKHYELSRIIL